MTKPARIAFDVALSTVVALILLVLGAPPLVVIVIGSFLTLFLGATLRGIWRGLA